MASKKLPKKIKVTKLNGLNVKNGDKIAVFTGAVAVLAEVIKATRDYCKLRKKKFDLNVKPYDPDNSIWMIDETFRQLRWLTMDDLNYLETNVGDYNEEADIYMPSCDTICDIAIYIERIGFLMRDVCFAG